MRAKIGAGDFAAVIHLRRFRVRVVEHDQADERRMVGRQVTGEGNDVFVRVRSRRSGSTFCAVPVLPADGETGHRRARRRAAIAHDAAQRVADLRARSPAK